MPSNRRRFTKPYRPELQRGHPLAHGLAFVTAPWLRGSSAVTIGSYPSGAVDEDERTRIRGDIVGSLPDHYRHRDMGVTITSGLPTVDPIKWLGQASLDIANARNGKFTMAVLFMTREATDETPQLILNKRDFAASGVGYTFEKLSLGGNRVRLQTDDGGSDEMGEVFDPVVNQTYHYFMTLSGATANLGRMYRDGTLVDVLTPGGPNPAGTNSEPVTMFGDSAGVGSLWDGEIGMAAIWDRQLPIGAMNMLYTDPYTLWKPIDADGADEDDEIVAAAAIADACCC